MEGFKVDSRGGSFVVVNTVPLSKAFCNISNLVVDNFVTNRPRALEDPAMQALQKRAHKIAEDEKAQQAEEGAEDADIIGRLVSATTSAEFRTATGAPPRQCSVIT